MAAVDIRLLVPKGVDTLGTRRAWFAYRSSRTSGSCSSLVQPTDACACDLFPSLFMGEVPYPSTAEVISVSVGKALHLAQNALVVDDKEPIFYGRPQVVKDCILGGAVGLPAKLSAAERLV